MKQSTFQCNYIFTRYLDQSKKDEKIADSFTIQVESMQALKNGLFLNLTPMKIHSNHRILSRIFHLRSTFFGIFSIRSALWSNFEYIDVTCEYFRKEKKEDCVMNIFKNYTKKQKKEQETSLSSCNYKSVFDKRSFVMVRWHVKFFSRTIFYPWKWRSITGGWHLVLFL